MSKFLSFITIALFVLVGCNEKSNGSSSPENNPPGGTPTTTGVKVPTDATAFYYYGSQAITLTDSKECYVEIRFSEDKKYAEVRSILTNPHELIEDPDHAIVGVGVLELEKKFLGGSIQAEAYYYENSVSDAAIKQLVVLLDGADNIKELRSAIFHAGHHDPVSCTNLNIAENQKLSDALDMFINFDEFAEHLNGEDHDHEEHE